MSMEKEKKGYWEYNIQIGQSNYSIDMKYKQITDNYKIILKEQSIPYYMVNTKDKIVWFGTKNLNDVLDSVLDQYS